MLDVMFRKDGNQNLWHLDPEDTAYEQGDGQGRRKGIGLVTYSEKVQYQGIQYQPAGNASAREHRDGAGMLEKIMRRRVVGAHFVPIVERGYSPMRLSFQDLPAGTI